MANRMMSYGYGTMNGKIVVIPSEAEIVKQIFAAYLSGRILKEIAIDLTERGVVFFEDKSAWNKNTVVRIIQNGKYIGENGYPVIIDKDTFEQANRKKNDKGHKKNKLPEIIEYLKTVVFCECGKQYHRRTIWGTREKWYCSDSCKCEKYIDDDCILCGIKKVLWAVCDNRQLLYKVSESPTYTKTQEIMRYTNEIGRFMNERAPSFKAVKKLIMECASLKFSACTYNANDTIANYIVEQLSQAQEHLSREFLRKTIERIIVRNDGTITVRFLGGIEVNETEIGGMCGNAS
jgi:hypothetical protein